MKSIVNRASKSRTAWIVGLSAATAVAVGTAIYFGEKTAAAATPPAAPQNLLSPITDAGTVRYYQNGIAQAIAAGKGNLLVGPSQPAPTTADYAVSDVDGNPANPKWMKVLAAFQTYANSQAPFTGAPAGFPAQLRTDGVLDYATAIVIANS